MYVNVIFIVIALGSIDATFGRVLYFEPRSSAIKANTDLCPDGSQCPGNDTCCPIESGDYGCCPLAMVSACTLISEKNSFLTRNVFFVCDSGIIN